jgi:hypothetical protein
LSVSLGSSQRDKIATTTILGEEFQLERRGTDGDLKLWGQTMIENDGKVDALCVGGADAGLTWNGKYYPFRDIQRYTRQVKQTPVVDGTGVKNSLEREMIGVLQNQGVVDFATAKVLLVCALDRFGMAEELAKRCPHLIIGDLMFSVGVPIPVHKTSTMNVIAALLLPVLSRTPFKWLYPVGEKQNEITPKYEKFYQWADVIAGDYLLVRKHLPARLEGKTIITNTTTAEDEAMLRERGVRLLVSSTPVVDGRSFGTNMLEGVFVTLLGKRPEQISAQEYLALAHRIGWAPIIRDLTAPETAPAPAPEVE